mgnify:FL=1
MPSSLTFWKYVMIFTVGILTGLWFGLPDSQERNFDNQTRYHKEAQWIARAVYSESKKFSNYEYIAWTIRNRMASERYPDNARSVVLQEDQFSAFRNPEKREKLLKMKYPETKNTYFRRAYRIALYVLNSDRSVNPMPEVTHFYMEDTMKRAYGVERPSWAEGRDPYFANGQTKYFRNIQAP